MMMEAVIGDMKARVRGRCNRGERRRKSQRKGRRNGYRTYGPSFLYSQYVILLLLLIIIIIIITQKFISHTFK